MKNMKVEQLLIPAVYIIGMAVIVTCLVAVSKGIKNFSKVYNGKDYVVKDVFDKTNPVIGNEDNQNAQNLISKPYISTDVKISKNYYDETATEEQQQKSIIYYGNTYIQNLGVEYSASNKFDIVSVADGEIISIKKDESLGYTVEIKHTNSLTTLYQYLSEVKIKEGSKILKGELIGISAKSIVEAENNYTLHFEVYNKGKTLNPEILYTMRVEDFK